jgi:hypothetical protein
MTCIICEKEVQDPVDWQRPFCWDECECKNCKKKDKYNK